MPTFGEGTGLFYVCGPFYGPEGVLSHFEEGGGGSAWSFLGKTLISKFLGSHKKVVIFLGVEFSHESTRTRVLDEDEDDERADTEVSLVVLASFISFLFPIAPLWIVAWPVMHEI